jgi:hypothetical protein
MPTRPKARLWWLALLLVVAFAAGCNRLGAAGSEDKAASGDRKLPFHTEAGAGQSSPGDTDHPNLAQAKDSLPFASPSHLRVLPSGTLITVRLEHPLDSSEVHAGDTFSAVVAEPVALDGDTMVARGAAVTGAIESAQESSAQRSTGYIRLSLNAISIDGKRLPLQTSSLFARGTAQPPGLHSVRATAAISIQLPAGRRLTFRLTVPASLDPRNSIANGQYSLPSTD